MLWYLAGDSTPCRPTLTCAVAISQTYTTGQSRCTCDNATYLDTSNGANHGNCIPKLTYNTSCKTESDCQDWLDLICGDLRDGTICKQCKFDALGWESCNTTVLSDTVTELICTLDICECDATVILSCPSINTGCNCQAGSF
ncbi:unnamed protein product [Adineta steineri]|uniref:Uncharacterized protein n=1 Tax=Adineta steineri TaxID=433720 RepID=A0A815FYM3_9BILA|nr:unnamed protein product [Adineta steineri]